MRRPLGGAIVLLLNAAGCGADSTSTAGEADAPDGGVVLASDAGSAAHPTGDAGAGSKSDAASPPRSDSGSSGGSDSGVPPSGADAGANEGGTVPGLNPPDTYVQLFKWRWPDIATECSEFLGPNGFGAVQISPPEASLAQNTWWDMYQPVNDVTLTSDMGNAAALAQMVATCHGAGVRVYADVVLNHMATGGGMATDGSSYSEANLQYPAFSASDFHSNCAIQDSDYSNNRANVVQCRLEGLPDLATENASVRTRLAQYLSALVALGVDGFRFDAAKHMWPADLQAILGQTPATTNLGEPLFVTQEVIPDGTVVRSDYFVSGTVNEFSFTYAVRDAFRDQNGASLSQLPAIVGTGGGGGSAGLDPSADVTVFVDNHDTERSRTDSLNLYDDGSGRFTLANIFVLAQPYGRAQIQSGFVFSFSNTDQNAPTASPYASDGSAQVMKDWDFVHRWPGIFPLVAFRSAVAGEPMTNVLTDAADHFAFGRGAKGFVALNNSTSRWTRSFQTGLPAGTYCNVAHGGLAPGGTACASDSATVDPSGTANLDVAPLGGSLPAAVVLGVMQMTK